MGDYLIQLCKAFIRALNYATNFIGLMGIVWGIVMLVEFFKGNPEAKNLTFDQVLLVGGAIVLVSGFAGVFTYLTIIYINKTTRKKHNHTQSCMD